MNPMLCKTLLPLGLFAASLPLQLNAVAVSWDGGDTDNNWSSPLNWSNDLVPTSGDDLTFGDVAKTDAATANNIVTASISVRDLIYNNTGATTDDWHVTQIDTGQILTVTRNLYVGRGTAATTTTNVKIQGDGSLNFSGTTFEVRSTANTTLVSLDLSGLASFNATATNFNVGGNSASRATLTLSQANTITATAVTVGNSTKNNTLTGQNSTLNLGANNTINTDTIVVGGNSSRQGGTIRFATADGTPTTGGSVTIRGSEGGASRTTLNIGGGTDGNNGPITSTVDFTGNSVDARFENLNIGYQYNSSGTNSSNLTGIFSMDAGTVDATAVTLGNREAGSNSATANGILNIGGGTFTAGSIIVGQTASATIGASGTLNITGGLVTVNGDVTEGTSAGGAVSSTLNLAGGTLNLTGNTITVDTFNLESGTLQNLGEFNNGAELVKTTTGTLVLDGVNTFTSNFTVSDGTFELADTGTLTFYIGENGVNNSVTGVGTVNFNGTFNFDLSNADLTSGNSWLIVDVANLTETFTGSFAITGFTVEDGVWTNGAGLSFDQSTGLLTFAAIPEPSTYAMLGGLAALGGSLLRRRRQARAC